MQILIRSLFGGVVDPDSLNPDPDADPRFDDQKFKKKSFTFFIHLF
jgi:hypothetical protein